MKIKRVDFDNNGFRNLHDLTIEIADRITVIGGHNGIGKSTILGLIANGSELKIHRTLLDNSFRADFSEIFFLDYKGDFKEREPEPSKATLTYFSEENEIIKECKVTGNQKAIVNKKQLKPFMAEVDEDTLTEKQKKDLQERHEKQPTEKFSYIYRMRVIPRTNENLSETSEGFLEDNNLGGSAKVEIPTIYLGMSRISPIGEFDPTHINLKTKQLPDEISDYINDFYNSVISFKKTQHQGLHSHTFGTTNKKSLVPHFEYSSLNISLGQDSLSSIVTAFASFYKLKLELKENYKGGILIIDEIEAGLHPKAQLRLMEEIKSQARKLNLQVIVTSHSLTIMKYILDLNNPIPSQNRIDSVIYVMDTKMPKVMEEPTYTKIKADMLLTEYVSSEEKDYVKVYFEDDEAKYFFEKILEFKNINSGDFKFGQNLKPISLKIGCEILIKLAQADSYFKTSVLIADNDVASSESNRRVIEENKNFCVLPASNKTNTNTDPKKRTPEYYVYDFLNERLVNYKNYSDFWKKMGRYTTDFIETNVLVLTENQKLDREEMKNWFKHNLNFFNEVNLLHKWCEENTNAVDNFIKELDVAINEAYQNLEMAKEFE